MNVRTRKPAAGSASTSTSAADRSRTAYINAVTARYGSTEVATSAEARRVFGIAYGPKVSRQKDGAKPSAIGISPISSPRVPGVHHSTARLGLPEHRAGARRITRPAGLQVALSRRRRSFSPTPDDVRDHSPW